MRRSLLPDIRQAAEERVRELLASAPKGLLFKNLLKLVDMVQDAAELRDVLGVMAGRAEVIHDKGTDTLYPQRAPRGTDGAQGALTGRTGLPKVSRDDPPPAAAANPARATADSTGPKVHAIKRAVIAAMRRHPNELPRMPEIGRWCSVYPLESVRYHVAELCKAGVLEKLTDHRIRFNAARADAYLGDTSAEPAAQASARVEREEEDDGDDAAPAPGAKDETRGTYAATPAPAAPVTPIRRGPAIAVQSESASVRISFASSSSAARGEVTITGKPVDVQLLLGELQMLAKVGA